jgi:tRNA1(Val) A37 N6-methylase TrmN6
LVYEQPATGYRVCVEALLVTWFATERRHRPFTHAVDLGSGPGAIALALAATGWAARVTAVELDPWHAELARRNVAANALDDRVEIVESDVAAVRRSTLGAADLVIANPPYFEPAHGAVAPDPRRAAARAFTRGALADFVEGARRLVENRGRVVLAMPASRAVEVVEMLGARGLHAKRMRFVHPREGREAQIVLVQAQPTRMGGLVVEPPWNLRGAGADYTEQSERALRGPYPVPEAGRPLTRPSTLHRPGCPGPSSKPTRPSPGTRERP